MGKTMTVDRLRKLLARFNGDQRVVVADRGLMAITSIYSDDGGYCRIDVEEVVPEVKP